MQPIHERMPVILEKRGGGRVDRTRDETRDSTGTAQALFFGKDGGLPREQPRQQCPP